MRRIDRYTAFQSESDDNRRLLLQEELILDVTEAISKEMEESGLRQKDLAERLGRTKGYVSQLLGGGRNLTLRTVADIAAALGCSARLLLRKKPKEGSKILPFPTPVFVPEWRSEGSFPAVRYRGFEADVLDAAVAEG